MDQQTELLETILQKLQKLEKKIDLINNEHEERLRDYNWVSEYLGVSRKTVLNYMKFKKLPFIKLDGNGSLTHFRKSEIDQWLEENGKVS